MDQDQISNTTLIVHLQGRPTQPNDLLGYVKFTNQGKTLDAIYASREEEAEPTRATIFDSIVSTLRQKADYIQLGSSGTVEEFLDTVEKDTLVVQWEDQKRRVILRHYTIEAHWE
jgi:hypothetical protein